MFINKQANRSWFYTFQLLFDTAIVVSAYLLGFYIQRPKLFETQPLDILYFSIAIIIVAITILRRFHVHQCGRYLYWQTMFNVLGAIAVITVSSIFMGFLFNSIGIWRRTVFYAVAIQGAFFMLIKLCAIAIHKRAFKPTQLILIGSDPIEICKLVTDIQTAYTHLYRIKNIFINEANALKSDVEAGTQIVICTTCSDEIKTTVSEFCILNNIEFFVNRHN